MDWPPSFGVYRLGMGPQPIVLYLATARVISVVVA